MREECRIQEWGDKEGGAEDEPRLSETLKTTTPTKTFGGGGLIFGEACKLEEVAKTVEGQMAHFD